MLYNNFNRETHWFAVYFKDPSFHKVYIIKARGDLSIADSKLVECSYKYSNGCAFVTKTKLAMLNANNEVTIFDFVEEVFSQPLPNIGNAKEIFPAPLGKFIVKTDSAVVFYDTITKYYSQMRLSLIL